MPVISKAQTDAHYQQRPLQPGNFAVNGRAGGEDCEEEVEDTSEDAAHERPVGEQEVLKMGWREGKLAGQVGGRDEGCEYQGQKPGIAVFNPKKENCETDDGEENGIRRQDLHRDRTGCGLVVASALQGAKHGRDHHGLRLSRPLHGQPDSVSRFGVQPGAIHHSVPRRC